MTEEEVAYFAFSKKDYQQNIYRFVSTKSRLCPLNKQFIVTIYL